MVMNLKPLLRGEVNTLSFTATADLSDLSFYGIAPFRSGVEVSCLARKQAAVISLEVRLSATLDTVCARCGENTSLPMEITSEFVLAKSLYNEERDDILLYRDDQLELDEIVRDLMVLNMDPQPLCEPDCKGMCYHCGANLNREPCRCIEK